MAIEQYLDDVEELSARTVHATFTDASGTPAIPATVHYRIDCVTNNQAIKASTSITPGSTVDIDVIASENAIIDSDNEYEVRQILITCNLGLASEQNKAFRWRVLNLAFKT